MNATAQISVVRKQAACTVLDGDAGLGPLVAVKGMNIAIASAHEYGIGLVSVRNSNNFAAAGYYAKMAANADMIGLAFTNADATIVGPGAAKRLIGNNPLGWAVPGPDGQTVYLDIAMSAVAGMKVAAASKENRPIPEGWVVDSQGVPTTDPDSMAAGGSLLPIGGYKGYGLAVMIETLTGVLSGAALVHQMHDWVKEPESRSNQGHLFIAINVESLMPVSTFKHRIGLLARYLREAKKAPGAKRILLPGDLEREQEDSARIQGVLLSHAKIEGLKDLAELTNMKSEYLDLING
jgi:LDH2 family malate/lactate/ureidoglycolate dehydrogenase